ncbi:MAG: WbqC family protein [Bacteroidota bacterium]
MNLYNPTMPLLLATSYFPPIEYFVLMAGCKNVMIDLHETYSRQTWRNRCVVLTANGAVNLTVPVEKPFGNHTKTFQVIISSHSPWQKNHWKTIEAAYRNAPYFLFYADLVKELLFQNDHILARVNRTILHALVSEMEMKINLEYTEEFVSNPGVYIDYRFAISPKPRDRQGKKFPVFEPYYQVFEDRLGFVPNASILDLIFNLGPDASSYIQETAERIGF